ncbi:uncharacterized protein SPPG_02386 [Spizellomyces punctatus DAOM BR117]|uniref:Protein kintoun n=1 Tax=Spizellomyces punctatus (strain DAOM BR117) TaxID=645134 RepID=A0A0L0HQJ8_SPIPD|nr:uncharacterized protein SPPG_02386 [Spizellomyces punctatus DAOM BR117]KND03343.1 hypothetical protein SPPG_02386 [Spizellomyces punctatus DAOM BR117]|eukprot:XP_016611382.1 hypothetical protein SPPG_02386 [Spizellomyces punctatus DAOM BR117]
MAATEGRKLDITPEEYKKIEQSLKNDQFRSLFMDYMKEIADPENRKLYEAELTQLEAERGNNIRFVKPTAGYVVKTAFAQGGEKVFINICTSPEIAEAKPNTTSAVQGAGQSWSIPYSLAPSREDVDHANKKCTVYDCVFHPETYAKGVRNPKFDKLLVSTAIEGIERQFNVKLEKKYKTPKMKFKGTPSTTVIRTADPTLTPQSDTTTQFLEQLQSGVKPTSTSKPATPSKPLIQELPETRKHASAAPAAEVVPKCTIIHRGINNDYQRFTEEREKQVGARPDALVVRIELPGVSTAAQVDLNTHLQSIDLVVPQKYKLNLPLPFPVHHDHGTAKFDRTRQELVVTLPVVPPPKTSLPESDAPFEEDEVGQVPPSPTCSEQSDGWIRVKSPEELRKVDQCDGEAKGDGQDDEDALTLQGASKSEHLSAGEHSIMDEEVCDTPKDVEQENVEIDGHTAIIPAVQPNETTTPPISLDESNDSSKSQITSQVGNDIKQKAVQPVSVQFVNTLIYDLDD